MGKRNNEKLRSQSEIKLASRRHYGELVKKPSEYNKIAMRPPYSKVTEVVK